MTAKEALLNNIPILISADKSYLRHTKMAELIALGADIHVREDNVPATFVQKLSFKIKCIIPWLNTFIKLKGFRPSLIIVSQRGTYDAASQVMMYNFLTRSKIPFVLISQFHVEHKAKLNDSVIRRARALFNLTHRFYFVSERNRMASEATIGRKIENACIINNPIKLHTEELLWPHEHYYHLACVARINFKVKRQDLIVKLLHSSKWRNRNIKLNLYGEGPDAGALHNLISKLGLDESIKMHGQVENLKEVWTNNHMFILPSVAEGLPLALIEANLLGRPAITTRVGDNERLVKNGITGFLVDDFSEQALDCALEQAWQIRDRWKLLGNNAFHHALQSLDVNIHKTLLSQLIEIANE
ncbi:glycosyltransferase involved in cell wall biosynthesis [Pontibacter aydingkolensis]|uniref:Glycosyltransferase family 4 protein n=1 Tax=Pontibacter aydingkolensis TaxID=1911536 RepID=A0ABS7CTQ7_9BACT|nr:glycosyltransferase family 4 protein [Pontibacter aydingkolensis]MBW7467212.1 glycosyltransferase family 4 protein [Pontibacter aydingkolensis]